MKENYKISPQQSNEERILLKEAIPLRTPLSLQIELASSCNFKCKFCMHGNPDLIHKGIYKLGLMEMDLFKKIVDDLKGFPDQIKFISLQCRGESLLNPEIVSMIRYLKKAEVTKQIVLNTNASLLTHDKSLKLIEAGLDVLRVSIEGINEKQYKQVSGVEIDFSNLINELTYFFKNRKSCYVYTKIIDCNMSDEDKKTFMDLFAEISDGIFIEQPVDIWKGAGLDADVFKNNRWNTKIENVEICPRIFFAYAVHYDGTIVSCDQDWKEDTKIGNAKSENMVEAWENNIFNSIRRSHLKNKCEDYDRCRECVIRKESLLKDNIDEVDREKLIQYYSN